MWDLHRPCDPCLRGSSQTNKIYKFAPGLCLDQILRKSPVQHPQIMWIYKRALCQNKIHILLKKKILTPAYTARKTKWPYSRAPLHVSQRLPLRPLPPNEKYKALGFQGSGWVGERGGESSSHRAVLCLWWGGGSKNAVRKKKKSNQCLRIVSRKQYSSAKFLYSSFFFSPWSGKKPYTVSSYFT